MIDPELRLRTVRTAGESYALCRWEGRGKGKKREGGLWARRGLARACP